MGSRMAEQRNPSPLIGYAIDGFPIYGPYTEDGDLLGWGGSFPSTAHPWYDVKSKLDKCNGRTRKDGSYVYHLTPSPPYTVGVPEGEARYFYIGEFRCDV